METLRELLEVLEVLTSPPRCKERLRSPVLKVERLQPDLEFFVELKYNFDI